MFLILDEVIIDINEIIDIEKRDEIIHITLRKDGDRFMYWDIKGDITKKYRLICEQIERFNKSEMEK